MNKRRSFVGLTTLAVVIIILFMLVFSSLAYLSSDSYNKSAVKRKETRELQYQVENLMIEEVYEIKEIYNGENLKNILDDYDLNSKENGYTGEIIIEDYRIIYYLEIDENVELKSYYLENIDEQEYGNQKFDF